MSDRKRPNAQERIAEALEALAADATRRAREREAEHHISAVDRIGSRQAEPKRLDIATFARGIPGYMALWNVRVPGQFWSLDGDIATVACPCGNAPEIEIGVPTFCKGWGCPRAYVYDGECIRVAFSPKQPSDTTTA